jgi:hypothetical protein
VGFQVSNQRSFTCQLYSLTFHLWGNGGLNWRRELELFIREETRSWKPATKLRASLPKLVSKSFADAIKNGPDPPLSGASGVPLGAPPHGPKLLTLRCRVPMTFRPVHPLRATPSPLAGASGVPLGAPPQGPTPGRHSVFYCLQPPSGAHVHGILTVQFTWDRFGDRTQAPFCQRCLSQGHHRTACRRPIRCHACFNWGHTAVNCPSGGNF